MKPKNAVIRARVPVEDRDRAQLLADVAGVTVSEMIRSLITNAKVYVRPSIVEVETQNAVSGHIRQDLATNSVL